MSHDKVETMVTGIALMASPSYDDLVEEKCRNISTIEIKKTTMHV